MGLPIKRSTCTPTSTLWTDNPIATIMIPCHGIDTQIDDLGSDDLQASEKKGLQQSAEQKDPRSGKSFEKPFDLIRRGHVCLLSGQIHKYSDVLLT